MGRNLAQGHGLVSSFYDVDAILEKGFPLGDVHMPGQAVAIAAGIALLGATEAAVLLPARLGFVLAGLATARAGERLAGPVAGLLASALLYLLPGSAGYAHSGMAELPILAVSAAFLAVWLGLLKAPHARHGPLLALLIGCGVLFRETLLVLVLPAAAALRACAPPVRRRASVGFALSLLAVGLALWPAYRYKAPHPHFLSGVLAAAGPSGLPAALVSGLRENLAALARPPRDAADASYLALCLLCLGAPLLARGAEPPRRQVGRWLLAAFTLTWLALGTFYPLRGWSGVRALLFLAPPAAVLVAARVAALRPCPRTGLLGLTLLCLGWLSVSGAAALARDRQSAYRADDPFSRFVEVSAAPFAPRLVVAEFAFLYGWRAWPVSVVWRATAQPAEIRALERVVPVDVIVAGDERKDALLGAVRRGFVRGGYAVAWSVPGAHVLVSERMRAQAAAAAGERRP